jgi:hypothetical protein
MMKTFLAIVSIAAVTMIVAEWPGSQVNRAMMARAAGAQAPTPTVSVTTLPAMPGTPTKAPQGSPTPESGMPLVTPAPTTTPILGGVPTTPPLGVAVIPVEGQVQHPLYLTLGQLQHMRATSLTLHFHVYTGVPLTEILQQAQPTFPDDPETLMRKYIYFQAIPPQQNAILSFPEFSKQFNGQIILLAYSVDLKDVKPPGFAELVVQGDKSNARFIKIARIWVGEPPALH